MIIRKMTIDDYEDVYKLWLSCKGIGLNNVDDSREGIAKFLKCNPDTCIIAEVNGEIAGVILVGCDSRRGYIYHTAVSPKHRYEGIGAAIVETVIRELKNMGITKVGLVAFERNADGNEFWEKQGFTLRSDLVYRDKALFELTRIDT